MSSENEKKDFKLTDDQISNFDIGDYAKGDFNLDGGAEKAAVESTEEVKKADKQPKAEKPPKEKKEFKLPKVNFEGLKKAPKEKEPKEKTPKREAQFSNVYTPTSGKGLALRIVLGLAIPYAYLMLCGLIFDRWLHLYNMTTFIFFSYVILALAGIAEIVLSIIKYVKRKK